MQKHLFPLCLILLWGSSLPAQNDPKATEILTNAVEKIKKFSAVEASFDLTMENKKENIRETHSGKAYMKENMYRIDVMEVINYFDGEAIYTYMTDVEEVNIKDPEEEQNDFLNPTILFDLHNRNFNQKLIEEKGGKAHIELIPKEHNEQMEKIGVWIDIAKNTVEKVTSFGRDGNDVVITIRSLKESEKPLDKAFFRFNPAEHPDVEVIDLR